MLLGKSEVFFQFKHNYGDFVKKLFFSPWLIKSLKIIITGIPIRMSDDKQLPIYFTAVAPYSKKNNSNKKKQSYALVSLPCLQRKVTTCACGVKECKHTGDFSKETCHVTRDGGKETITVTMPLNIYDLHRFECSCNNEVVLLLVMRVTSDTIMSSRVNELGFNAARGNTKSSSMCPSLFPYVFSHLVGGDMGCQRRRNYLLWAKAVSRNSVMAKAKYSMVVQLRHIPMRSENTTHQLIMIKKEIELGKAGVSKMFFIICELSCPWTIFAIYFDNDLSDISLT